MLAASNLVEIWPISLLPMCANRRTTPHWSEDSVQHQEFRAILAEILEDVLGCGALEEKHLLRLDVLCPKLLKAALPLIDRELVHRFETRNSGRYFYSVVGKKAKYMCHEYYCSCPSFMYMVYYMQEDPICKHQLGAMLSYALGRYHMVVIEDAHFAEALLQG